MAGDTMKTARRRTRSEEIRALVPKQPSKFRNIGTMVDGLWFQSRLEAKRYSELKLLEKAGAITALRLQPRYPLMLDGVTICEYRADFSYVVPGQGSVTEDAKGVETPIFKLKRKFFEAQYKRPIHIVKA